VLNIPQRQALDNVVSRSAVVFFFPPLYAFLDLLFPYILPYFLSSFYCL